MAEEETKETVPEVIEEQSAEEIKQDWMDDLQIGLTFLTRIPVPGGLILSNPSLAQSTRFFPIIGALVGFIGGVIILVADFFGLPLVASVIIALLSIILITGAKNEDGLAHTADVITKRGEDKEQQFEIIRDNQFGTTGILVLIFTVALKWSALSTTTPSQAIVGIILMTVISYGSLPLFMRYIPATEDDSLPIWNEQPEFDKITVSVVISLIISFFAVGFLPTLVIIIVLIIILGLASWLVIYIFGGKTRQVLGGLQQISEIFVCLSIAALNI